MSENRTEDAKSPPARRRFRSGKERSADKTAAVVRRERLRIEAQRARDQRDVERIEAKQEKRRLRNQASDERRSGDARDKGEARQTDLLTQAAALIATIVAGQGMWQFLDRILGDVHWSLRVLMFAFLEIAVITSAIRAKRNIRKNLSAGIDGKAVWVLTSASAALATMEARSLPEAVFRLVAPLVAAWLWERGMAIERHRLRGTSGIHWRITPERLLVRLGLAEATDRTAGQVDAYRRITRVALAAKRVHDLRKDNASKRKVRKAVSKRARLLDQAVEHAGLAKDKQMQWLLLDMVSTLGGAESISDLISSATGPWAHLDHPAITGASKNREASELSDAIREWTEQISQQRDPETHAAITSMAAWITGKPVGSETLHVTPGVTSPVVTDLVTRRVTDDVTKTALGEVGFGVPMPPDVTPPVTAPVTPSVTTNPVTKDVTADPKPEPDEQSKTQLMRDLWDRERAGKRYPTVQELADHASAHHTLASRKRREWVTELAWHEQRKADPKKVTAS